MKTPKPGWKQGPPRNYRSLNTVWKEWLSLSRSPDSIQLFNFWQILQIEQNQWERGATLLKTSSWFGFLEVICFEINVCRIVTLSGKFYRKTVKLLKKAEMLCLDSKWKTETVTVRCDFWFIGIVRFNKLFYFNLSQ